MDVASLRTRRIAAAEEREQRQLEIGLEYPAGSGIYHSLAGADRGKYNEIQIRKAKLPAGPILVKGKDKKIISVTRAQIDEFDDLATAHVIAINQASLAEIDALWRATTAAEIDAIPLSNP